ncbi:MAG TPA: glycosyltransferase family 2 protein [Rhizomicrobium sp.]|nr:glycosyltransferase family 2 protein [Rhizomicrobium sp.]
MQLSVVIPCLNEIETIRSVVKTARAALEKEGLSGEVIVADNGSDDGSQRAAQTEGARVIDVSVKGYGSALSGGIVASQSDAVIFADADCSYDFGELRRFWDQLEAGADLVVGTRFPRAGGILDPGAMPWLHRYVGTPALSLVGRILFSAKLSDFNCGMRAITRTAYDKLNLQTPGMEFASEMIIKASLFGLRICEVPIHFHKDARGRPPHLRTFRDGWRHLRFMLICSPRWLFLYPGLVLLILGLMGGLALMPGPVHVGHIGFDTNTLLVCAMMLLLGNQLISMGTVAKFYAVQIGMHPQSRSSDVLRATFGLERWAIIGLFFQLAGMALLGFGVFVWNKVGFGPLSYPDSLRIVIPAVTLIMLGTQIIFHSFLIGMVSRAHA